MILSALSLLTTPVLSNLVAIHPHGCDNEMMYKLCHNSDKVSECYTCVRTSTNMGLYEHEVCVPVFKYNHEYKNPLDRFPSHDWNCTLHQHNEDFKPVEPIIKPDDDQVLEDFVDVLGEILSELDEVEEILHKDEYNHDNHFLPHVVSAVPHSNNFNTLGNGCGGEKFKCMLRKSCRNLLKDLKNCENEPTCMIQLIAGTNDEHFLRLVECMNGN
jgi:hypothetical protein